MSSQSTSRKRVTRSSKPTIARSSIIYSHTLATARNLLTSLNLVETYIHSTLEQFLISLSLSLSERRMNEEQQRKLLSTLIAMEQEHQKYVTSFSKILESFYQSNEQNYT